MFFRHLYRPMFPRKTIVGFADQVYDQTNLITCDPICTKKLAIIQSLTSINKYFKFHPEKRDNLCCVRKSRYRLLLDLVSYPIKLRYNTVTVHHCLKLSSLLMPFLRENMLPFPYCSVSASILFLWTEAEVLGIIDVRI